MSTQQTCNYLDYRNNMPKQRFTIKHQNRKNPNAQTAKDKI